VEKKKETKDGILFNAAILISRDDKPDAATTIVKQRWIES
jgi:hypothetical protein